MTHHPIKKATEQTSETNSLLVHHKNSDSAYRITVGRKEINLVFETLYDPDLLLGLYDQLSAVLGAEALQPSSRKDLQLGISMPNRGESMLHELCTALEKNGLVEAGAERQKLMGELAALSIKNSALKALDQLNSQTYQCANLDRVQSILETLSKRGRFSDLGEEALEDLSSVAQKSQRANLSDAALDPMSFASRMGEVFESSYQKYGPAFGEYVQPLILLFPETLRFAAKRQGIQDDFLPGYEYVTPQKFLEREQQRQVRDQEATKATNSKVDGLMQQLGMRVNPSRSLPSFN